MGRKSTVSTQLAVQGLPKGLMPRVKEYCRENGLHIRRFVAESLERKLQNAKLDTGKKISELTEKERDTLLHNINLRLDRLVKNIDVEDADESPVLVYLRKIKPAIQASGNVKAIDAYNNAVRAIKREQRRVLAGGEK